ncbi:MAG: phosphotransferase [Micromonosporaceae bacterium]
MKLLAAGRTADVYALDDHRVLRRYRDGRGAEPEAALLAYLRDQSFPVPAVESARDGDMVLERLGGEAMAAALLGERVTAEAAAAILADLHTRLHALPARSANPAVRILHLDLHPENVILTDQGPYLIDWRNATEGDPWLDVALTALILGQVAVGDYGLPPAAVRALLTAFLGYAGPVPQAPLERAVAIRAADPNITPAEVAQLGTAADLVRDITPPPAG